MNIDIVNRFITLPMAIKNIKDDREKFAKFSMAAVYLSMIDDILEQMQKEFYKLKGELVSKYHVEVRCISKGDVMKYSVRGNGIDKVLSYTSGELKEMTRSVMRDYSNINKDYTRGKSK